MFIYLLEFEDNLRMSKNFSDQESDDKMEKELELNEPCEREEPPLPSNSSLYGKEKDQINVERERDDNHLFYENYSQLIISPVGDDPKKVFRLSVYDEYEDDY